MITVDWLDAFYATIAEDPRINTTLISVYIALVYECLPSNLGTEFEIERKVIMKRSKVNSFTTYCHAMHALHEFGYIKYMPKSGRMRSKVILRRL